MNEELDQVGLADKRVETSQYDRYKGRKDNTDRLAFLSTTLQRVRTHFCNANGQRNIFQCLSTKEKRAVCCEVLGEPGQRFGMVVFRYATDEHGELTDSAKCQGKLLYWAVSESRYEELSSIHRSWPLLDAGKREKQYDLTIKCTEESWQRMTFTPTPEAHWKRKPEWYDALKGKEEAARQKLKMVMGKKLNEQEVKDLVGAGEPVSSHPPTQATDDIDLSNAIDEL